MENGEKGKLKQFKRLKAPQMIKGTRNRREICTSYLRKIYKTKICMIKIKVCQDKKDFTLEVPLNLQNKYVFGKGAN